MSTSEPVHDKPVETRIRAKIMAELMPVHFEIENESYKHAVPRGSETHFKVPVYPLYFTAVQHLNVS